MSLISLTAIALGGALGALSRHAVASFVGLYGIVTVNIIGCFIVGGLVTYLSLKTSLHRDASLFLFVGLLGGFTTFSAFSVEVMAFVDTNRYGPALLYILASVGGGLAAFILGRFLIKLCL